MTRGALVAALVALAGCEGDAPPVRTCADSLAGVWRTAVGAAADGRPLRYEIVDTGARIELHPLFDSARNTPELPARSAHAFVLTRAGERATGHQLQWRTNAEGSLCRAQWPAELRACRGATLELAYQPGEACGAPPGPWRTIYLGRD